MPRRKEMLSQRRKCNKSFSLHEYQSLGFFFAERTKQTRKHSSRMRTARLPIRGGSLLGGLCPGESLFRDGGLCWGGVCYLFVVPAPTETEHQCSCLYSAA